MKFVAVFWSRSFFFFFLLYCGTETASNLRLRALVCWNWGQQMAFYLKMHSKLLRPDMGFGGMVTGKYTNSQHEQEHKSQLGRAETKALGFNNILWPLENTNSQSGNPLMTPPECDSLNIQFTFIWRITDNNDEYVIDKFKWKCK